MDTEYTDAIANYLRQREAAEAEIKAADEAYRAETAALVAAADAARTTRDDADHAAEEAAALVAETDKTVAVLWRALSGLVGHRLAGPTPYGHAPKTQTDAAAVHARLKRAARLLDLARQGELPIEAPRHTEITAAAFGAAVGAIAVALTAWILGADADGSEKAVRQALAAATLFSGVATGPIAFGPWLSRQYRVRPRPTQTVACVAGAVVATGALAGVFLRGM